MMTKKILITGITGFIGFHIAEELLKKKYEIIGLKRSHSDCWRCVDISDKIKWVDIDDDFVQKIVALKPDIIIHCAWNGAGAESRNNSEIQNENLKFLETILQIAGKLKIEKFISLGSQAEYGYLKKAAAENNAINPDSDYGKAKVSASKMVEKFCNESSISWYWLRLFSFYGSKENSNWFIPFIISSFITNKSTIPLSPGTQKYAYLYINDFVKYILKLVQAQNSPSGVYNVSGSKAIPLKEVVLKIESNFKSATCELDFDALPVRQNQSIVLKGNMSKFHKNIGSIKKTSFEVGIKKTIEYYKREIK